MDAASAQTSDLALNWTAGRPSGAARLLKAAQRNPGGAIACCILAAVVVLAVFGRGLAPYDPLTTGPHSLKGPSLAHLMGTDEVGRDLFSRIMVGARPALEVALAAVAAGITVGSLLGIVSGYYQGKLDMGIQRGVDGVMALPPLLLALGLVSLLGPGLRNGIIAIAVTLVPSVARVVRAAVLTVGHNLYITAALSTGASSTRIMFRHLLPNVAAPIVIITSAYLGGAVLLDASLSFLGLGTQPPTPSWGSMLSGAGRQYFERDPWIGIFPGVMISITVLAFNVIGDALRDELDPRLRNRR